MRASGLIVMHNHPGQLAPTPSEQDRGVTYRLQEAGRILGIELVDHILIGEERFYSFQEHFFH